MCCSTEIKNLGEVSRHDAATSCRLVRFSGKLPKESGATTPRNPSPDAESGGRVLQKRKGNGESRPAPAAVQLRAPDDPDEIAYREANARFAATLTARELRALAERAGK